MIFRVEVPANRYDLLSFEGLVTAFKVFLGVISPPRISLSMENPEYEILVDSSVCAIRPYIVGAVLRGINFTPSTYRSFIDCQDKLHQNLCRRRTLVAMGTHDLSKISTKTVNYSARSPSVVKFVPLKQTVEMTGSEIMDMYKTHPEFKEYCRIISASPVFPVITDDAANQILSLTPIINSEHSKITLQTRNVFVEMAANDLTKANVCLNTFVAAFSQYCAEPFTVEPVVVRYANDHTCPQVCGKSIVYPNLQERKMHVKVETIQNAVDPKLTKTQICSLLNRMSCPSVVQNDTEIAVTIPIYRSDIMHACDIVEDVCIAYGFGNIVPIPAPTLGRPREQPINRLSDLVREKLAMFGYDECLNWTLLSENENYGKMEKTISKNFLPVRLSNPKTREFEIVRTSLLPGILKVVASNKHNSIPLRLFEVGDVVFDNQQTPLNERRVATVYAGKTSGFELKHGLLNGLMRFMVHVLESELGANFNRIKNTYKLVPSNDPTFLKEMQGEIVLNGATVGVIGVIHPKVLEAFGIDFAVASAIELNLEPFLEAMKMQQ